MGGGGAGQVGQLQAAEEAKRADLRQRLNQFYGIDSAPSRSKEEFYREVPTMVDAEGGPAPTYSRVFDEEAYNNAVAGSSDQARAANLAMEKEETDLSKQTRDYYEDQLQRGYEKSERQNRFALANRGLLRGSVDVDTNEELSRSNQEGGARVGDEVLSALSNLRNQREQERLQSINLINSGSGEEAVASASSGLNRALQNTQARQKADITSDLFQTGVTSLTQDPSLLAAQRYRDKLRTFYPTSGRGGVKIS